MDEMKPSPNAVCHDATGSFSTGIMLAQSTSESRKMDPLNDSGTSDQCGLRSHAVPSRATQTAKPRNGARFEISWKFVFITTFTVTASPSTQSTTKTRAQSTFVPLSGSAWMGAYFCCMIESGMAKIRKAVAEPIVASITSKGLTPAIHIMVVVVSPTTLPAPPALDAAMMPAR